MQQNTPQTQVSAPAKKGGSKAIVIILIMMMLVLGAASAFLGWKFIESGTKYKGLEVQKIALDNVVSTQSKQLDTLKIQLKAMEGSIPASVADSLNKAIADLQTQIANAPTRIVYTGGGGGGGNKKQIDDLKFAVADWQSKYEKLVVDMASLKKEKDKLATDVTALNQEKGDLANKNKTLQDKVDLAAQLTFADVMLSGYKLDKKSKKTYEDKVKKIAGLEVSFKIMENNVADPGDKIAYIVITGPDKKVLADTWANAFQVDGVDKIPSIQQNFYFANKQALISAEFKTKVPLKPGDYSAEIYVDGKLCGTAKHTLKK